MSEALTLNMILARSRSEYTETDIQAYERRKRLKLEQALKNSAIEHQWKIIANSGLKDAVKNLTFDSFMVKSNWQKVMKEIAIDYAKHPEGWLLLSGQSGCGKTHLCTAVAGSLLNRGIPVRYMQWRLDVVKIKPNYSSVEEADKEMRRYINVPCLYIDDLFKGKITEADVNAMFTLLNGRYAAGRKTIISTELTMDELMVIDSAIAGRIAESCGKHKVIIKPDDSKNYRLANKR